MAAEEHVVISVPSKGSCDIEFVSSLVAMIAYTIRHVPSVMVEMNYAASSSLIDNRMTLVDLAKETHPTHLLFVDDDMTFPRDTLARLLRHKKPIICANYTSRKFPCVPWAVRGSDRIHSQGKTGLERVDHCGLGLSLIEASVFEKMEEPFFYFGWDRKTRRTVGEDVWFFKQAKKLGFEAWVDHDLSQDVGHLGKVEFSHDLIDKNV